MNKVYNAIITAVTEIDAEIERLTKIKQTLQGKAPTAQPVKKRKRTQKYELRLDGTVELVFDDNPDTIMDTKTVLKEVKKLIPNVNPSSVSSTVSILCRKGYVERTSPGRYIKRSK